MAKSNTFFNIDMLVLSILKVNDCYGYEIIKMMKSISNDAFIIREGTLYPIVHNLLKKGYISSYDVIANKKIRVYYHIEDSGIEYLNTTISDFRNLIQGVFDIINYGEDSNHDKHR